MELQVFIDVRFTAFLVLRGGVAIKKGRVTVRGGEMQIVRELTEAINSVVMSPVVFYHGVCSIPLTALAL